MEGDWERVQEFGECEYASPSIFSDLDGRQFFASVRVHNKLVSIGDLVQVVLEGDDDDDNDVGFAYCQVLAIYDEQDTAGGDGVKFEARWYHTFDELDTKQQRLIPDSDRRAGELFETDVLDDVPIGSVSEHIRVLQTGTTTGLYGKESDDASTAAAAAAAAGYSHIADCRTADTAGTAAVAVVVDTAGTAPDSCY